MRFLLPRGWNTCGDNGNNGQNIFSLASYLGRVLKIMDNNTILRYISTHIIILFETPKVFQLYFKTYCHLPPRKVTNLAWEGCQQLLRQNMISALSKFFSIMMWYITVTFIQKYKIQNTTHEIQTTNGKLNCGLHKILCHFVLPLLH